MLSFIFAHFAVVHVLSTTRNNLLTWALDDKWSFSSSELRPVLTNLIPIVGTLFANQTAWINRVMKSYIFIWHSRCRGGRSCLFLCWLVVNSAYPVCHWICILHILVIVFIFIFYFFPCVKDGVWSLDTSSCFGCVFTQLAWVDTLWKRIN